MAQIFMRRPTQGLLAIHLPHASWHVPHVLRVALELYFQLLASTNNLVLVDCFSLQITPALFCLLNTSN